MHGREQWASFHRESNTEATRATRKRFVSEHLISRGRAWYQLSESAGTPLPAGITSGKTFEEPRIDSRSMLIDISGYHGLRERGLVPRHQCCCRRDLRHSMPCYVQHAVSYWFSLKNRCVSRFWAPLPPLKPSVWIPPCPRQLIVQDIVNYNSWRWENS